MKEAVEEERRRCEAQQAEAVRVQRERLEEEIRQRERSVALALKEEAAQLKTVRPLPCGIAKVGREARRCCARTIDVAGPSLQKLQEMERDSCAQQGGREPWLAAVCQTLGEEHQAEPQRWQKDASQVLETPRGNICGKGGGEEELSRVSVVAGQTEAAAAAAAGAGGDPAAPNDARRKREQLPPNDSSDGGAAPALGPGPAGPVQEPALPVRSERRQTPVAATSCQVGRSLKCVVSSSP